MGNYWLDTTLSMWRCADVEYIIAYTLDDAKWISHKQNGYSWDELEEWDWHEMDIDFMFKFTNADGTEETKTVQEWIDEHGEGYFACSEF